MTIFRFRFVACVASSLALVACQQAPSKTVSEIIASPLTGEALLMAFSERLDDLDDEGPKFASELEAAGFVFKEFSQVGAAGCGNWEYPVRDTSDSKALRAFVQTCPARGGNFDIGRVGISRGPMTYD